MSSGTDLLNCPGNVLVLSLLTKLYTVSPYEDFDYQAIPLDLQGWGSTDSIFDKLISMVQPKLILEVGTWKGASAIHMVSLLKQKGIDGVIVCIDTWLGGLEHLIYKEDPELGLSNFRKHGYPTLYYQFLANVMHQKLQDWIVPFPSTSNIAAKWFEYYQIKADLIYIDSSHDQEDVYNDLENYWPLLTPNGVLFGDDWSEPWPGVVTAVSKFAKVHRLDVEVDGEKWFFQKVQELKS